MQGKRCFAVVVLLVWLAQVPAAAQQAMSRDARSVVSVSSDLTGQLPIVDKNGGWLFRRQVDEVTVMFTATHKGKYVADLQPADVQVQDDKKSPAEIMAFRNEQDLPLRLGLLIDTSGSVNERFRYEKQAASQFVKQVVNPQHDRVFVAGFSHGMRVTQDFTQDPSKVSSGLDMLQDDQGDTALFDALARACNKLAASPDQQPVARVLVVISDGDDNASQHALQDAAQIAQWSEVTIYTISSNPRGLNPIGDDVLHKLGEQSGGRALFADSKEKVTKAFTRIRDELRNRYAVSYRPSAFKPDGHFRRIRIVVRRFGKKLRVHARKGYYARPILADLMGASRR
jgi:Ca-activated chloride channel family protein